MLRRPIIVHGAQEIDEGRVDQDTFEPITTPNDAKGIYVPSCLPTELRRVDVGSGICSVPLNIHLGPGHFTALCPLEDHGDGPDQQNPGDYFPTGFVMYHARYARSLKLLYSNRFCDRADFRPPWLQVRLQSVRHEQELATAGVLLQHESEMLVIALPRPLLGVAGGRNRALWQELVDTVHRLCERRAVPPRPGSTAAVTPAHELAWYLYETVHERVVVLYEYVPLRVRRRVFAGCVASHLEPRRLECRCACVSWL
jgi:hypothetical protein